MNCSFVLSIALLISRFNFVVGNGCWLCNEVARGPTDWTAVLPDGATCADYYANMFSDYNQNDSECADSQEYVSSCCCGSSVPDSCLLQTRSYVEASAVEVTGDQPVCNICINDNEVPGIPGGFVVIRYVGSFSCLDLYYHGLKGEIDDYMCGPVQDYVYSVCGCGEGGSVVNFPQNPSSEAQADSSSPRISFNGPKNNVDGAFILFVGIMSFLLLLFISMMCYRRHCRSSRRRY